MGKIIAICTSAEKGTAKQKTERAEFLTDYGIKGDAHAGNWHRQVSLLSFQKIEEFRAKGATVKDGDFGENLIIAGIDLRSLPVGTILKSGEVILQITQIGKECHNHCAIYNVMGDCIMPREGVFAKVIRSGFISEGDEISVNNEQLKNNRGRQYRVWIITASDKGFAGEREDVSASVIRRIAEAAGYTITGYTLLADNQADIENELKRICDNNLANLILTTGGTGFSLRDCMPEATMAIAHRSAPGIAEAMRSNSMTITKRAMLSRGAAVIRENTLIINLPGSPKAARENLEFIINELHHGLEILTGNKKECGNQ